MRGRLPHRIANEENAAGIPLIRLAARATFSPEGEKGFAAYFAGAVITVSCVAIARCAASWSAGSGTRPRSCR